jgi:UDP-GlcNAc:undecaprenyl-phosphate GlcNAc-1-phosphate transferase
LSEGGPAAYVAILVGSSVLTLVLTPLALRYALRRQVLDHPGGHKGHTSPVPYLGGVAIVLAFSAAIVVASLVRGPRGRDELLAVVGIAVGLALLGLVDDLRGLGPFIRVTLEVAAGVGLWYFGDGALLFGNDGLNLLLTVVWVVGITNALNLLDNMDGLSAGVAAIAAGWFFVIAAANGQFLVASLSLALAGCALGFLFHNFHPATIYMGDAGSLFLGFMLAAIGVKLRFEGPTQVTFFVPILVLGVAIFDTTLVTVMRLVHRRSPLSGGRDHTSHRLVLVGLPVPGAVTLIYGGAVALGWLALVMSRVDRPTGLILMGFVLTVAAFVGVLLAMVPVYETSSRRRVMISAVTEHEVEPVERPQPMVTAR